MKNNSVINANLFCESNIYLKFFFFFLNPTDSKPHLWTRILQMNIELVSSHLRITQNTLK